MREVAERANVAMSSVSRVLNEHPDVSDAMRERVLAAVRELGYSPDVLAQSLRRRETRSVGFIVGDISNPLFAEIVKGCETTLRDAGYAMLLTNSEGDPALDAANVRLFERRRVDALILSTAQERHRDTAAALRAIDVPMVFLDRDPPPRMPASRVLADHHSGMVEAVSHLLDLGHRRVGFVAGSPVRPTRERLRGLKDAYERRGLDPEYVVESPTDEHDDGPFSIAHGEAAGERLLSLSNPPTALIAGGNQLLLGVLRALGKRRVRIGRDLAVVSCDDVALAELFEPQIAVISRDTRRMGAEAAALLLRELAGERDLEDVVIPTHFVARPSVGRLRSSPPAQT